jgi:hypothetical protein
VFFNIRLPKQINIAYRFQPLTKACLMICLKEEYPDNIYQVKSAQHQEAKISDC